MVEIMNDLPSFCDVCGVEEDSAERCLITGISIHRVLDRCLKVRTNRYICFSCCKKCPYYFDCPDKRYDFVGL